MRSDELLSWLRLDAYIGDAAAYPDQTDEVLLNELTHKLHSVFEDIIVKARSGCWLKYADTTTTSGKRKYRIPGRAVVGGLEAVEIAAVGGTNYGALKEIPATDVQDWDGISPGTPQVFCLQGDYVALYPVPNAVFPLRLSFYMRPPKLVPQQSSTVGGGTIRGRLVGINPVTRNCTVNVLPLVYEDGISPATITSGDQRIDIIRPDGWFEPIVFDVSQTFTGTSFTLGGTQDLSDVQAGDFMRAAGQSEWPQLPADFHRCLADVAAIKVAVELSLREKNDELASNVESDLVRFRSLLLPRVKSEPKTTPVSLKTRGGGGARWLP